MAQAKAKSNSVVTTEWSGDILTIEVLGAGAIMFDRTAASADNRDWAEKHGWTQRLSNRAAISRDPKTGQPATAQVKYDAIKTLADYYESGDVPWKMGTTASAEGSLLFRALVIHRPDKTAEQLTAFLESRTPQQLTNVKRDKELVKIMNQLRLEAVADIDVGDALGDLDSVTVDEEISALMTDE